jgi:NTP pyrophosphatase (non-canonical NTP hydrolase)
MNMESYQKQAERTMQSKMTPDVRQCNWAMGLAGEAGETCDYLKKVICHNHELDVAYLEKELGDVLWYIAAIATEYGLNMDDIAHLNIEKLRKRYPEGFSTEMSIKREDTNV